MSEPPQGLAARADVVDDETENPNLRRERAYAAFGEVAGGDSSDEEGGASGEVKGEEGEEEEVGELPPYAQLLGDDDEEEFGDFEGPALNYQMDDATLFSRVLANLDLREERRAAGGGFDDDELFPASSAVESGQKPVPVPSSHISVPPLDAEKRASILAAMAKMKPPTRPSPTADLLADAILAKLQRDK